MRSRFITDPQDPFDSFLNTAWDEFHTNFFPAPPSNSGENPSASTSEPLEILATPALTSEAVQSSSAQSGPTTVTALTTGGITINLLFDAAAMAAPASFRAGIQQAASILTSAISDKITVNIKIDYSGTGGGAAAGPDAGLYESYTSVRADLINNGTPGDTTFNALPSGSSIQGQTNVAVWNAQLKLWGILGANDTTTDDGSATFATDINSNLLVGVALHELTHAMGRVPYGSAPDIFDLFRFTSNGTRLLSGSVTAPAAYFSVDGGTTKLADYGKTSDPSDFLNSGVQGSSDPFNEFYGGGTLQSLTTADKIQLDALGFHTAVAQNGFVVAATASQALQGGPAVTLLSGPPTITDPASTTLSSATIKIANAGGSAVTGDQLYIDGQQSGTVDGGLVAVSWDNTSKTLNLVGAVSIAAYQTLLSQITYQDAGTDSSIGSHPLRTTTWTVNDGTTNITATSQIAIDRPPIVTVANVALNAGYLSVAASSLFTASDPDNDTIATYGFKDTGNGYFVLNEVVQAHNQEIDVTAAQLSQLAYQNATGTDALQVRVNDGMLWSNWANFTVTGPVVTVIQTDGSTSLTQVGNNFYLYNSGGTGPELKFGGTAVVAGQFAGGLAPVGAELTATGYDVAWKAMGPDQYTVWSTDSSGNCTGNLTGTVSGTSTALESLESVFHQDLNGDGVIGFVTSVIESFGSTSLTQVGNNYYLYNSGGTGPELKFVGAAVVSGQFAGGLAPIGAELTATGYDVAWKAMGADQYTVWSTDSSGNCTGNLTGTVSGTSTALESLESVFHQDLNGDGVIGFVTSVIESFGSTSLTQVGNNYYLYNSGGTGPELKFVGAAVVSGQFAGGVAPIGAELTATGYDVAWKAMGADQYTVWSTDSSGNCTGNLTGTVSGTSTALESLESVFHQDLNGDGVIGFVTNVIESFGSTSLTQVGNNYYLYNGGGTGPELKFVGAAVVSGQFAGGLAPIGAELTATGYDVAWKAMGADQYTVWSTDSSGNCTGNLTGTVSGTSTALESLESVFHQDLNGDGVIGFVTSVIESFGSTSLTQVGNNYYLYNSGGTGPELKFVGAAVVSGQFAGGLAPIGAELTASGYDVAWKAMGADQYTVWSTDSSGNCTGNLTGTVSGTSTALESLESVFHQDLNGDGVIGLAIQAGSILELSSAQSGSITFIASTGILKLDAPSTFNGQIAGFRGDGTLLGSDQIDLLNTNYNSSIQINSTYDNSTGILSVNNGSTVDHLHFIGNYNQANFKFESDDHGGTIIYDPPTASQPISQVGANDATVHVNGSITVSMAAGVGQDNFIFSPNFGQATISHFSPGIDILQIDHAMFASIDLLLAATHDDPHGNAVITDAAHDTITIQNVTTAQLLVHHDSFHLV